MDSAKTRTSTRVYARDVDFVHRGGSTAFTPASTQAYAAARAVRKRNEYDDIGGRSRAIDSSSKSVC
mgnify:CR=1 FL=1